MPSESTILLIVYNLRVVLLIWNRCSDFLQLVLHFPVDFECLTPFGATETQVSVKIDTMMSELLQVKQIRMYTLISPHRNPIHFEICVYDLIFEIILFPNKLIQIVIIEVFISCLQNLLHILRFNYINCHKEKNWLSIIILVIWIFHTIKTDLDILSSTFVKHLVFDEHLVKLGLLVPIIILWLIVAVPLKHLPALDLEEAKLNAVFLFKNLFTLFAFDRDLLFVKLPVIGPEGFQRLSNHCV